ncbi:MAG: ABC transporter permease [Rhodovibrionaceae bacterium]|nr:ABC transporter permease [Rhodovibrionaceae bacterium]
MPSASLIDSNAGQAGGLSIERRERVLVLRPEGEWTVDHLKRLDREVSALSLKGASRVSLVLDGLEELDTGGAWLLHKLGERLEGEGLNVEVSGAHEGHLDMLDLIAEHAEDRPAPPPKPHPFLAFVENCGRAAYAVLGEGRDLLNFLGLLVIALIRALLQPWRWRPKAVFTHMETAGLNALPIVGLLTFLIGVVLAYQGADQLARFGAEIFTVNLVGVGVLRELGILITAIIVAGRSGSAFTAEIGTMKVNEEVDAMRTIGLDPVDVLVLPRVVALVVVMPLLTFYADIMALAGGAAMSYFNLDISPLQFVRQMESAVDIWTFGVGMIKAPLFAFIIAMVGCFQGLKVSGSADSVGRETTRAVVVSIFLVIVLDALLSIFFSLIGI